jgi:cation diffusion facilitator family transporter
VDRGTLANAVGLVANAGLALAKFTLGTLAGSTALVADGFNSAGDVVATGIAFAGYRYGRIPADENHPFGHHNAESVAGLVIGGILLSTGVFVALEGGRALARGPTSAPELLAVWVALGNAAVKEGLYRYTTHVGRSLGSPALLASARDHRADVFIALTVLAGIVAARTGAAWLDPAAALAVGLYIAWMAWEPLRANFGVLMDEAPPELTREVRAVVAGVPGVQRVDLVRLHPMGGSAVADVEIAIDGAATVAEGHEIAHRVHDVVLREVEGVHDVRVHTNPA